MLMLFTSCSLRILHDIKHDETRLGEVRTMHYSCWTWVVAVPKLALALLFTVVFYGSMQCP